MKRNHFIVAVVLLAFSFIFSGCKGSQPGGGFNLFSVQQDRELGLKVKAQIESDTKQFPILNEANNKEAYRIIRDMTNEILNSGRVYHRDAFAWEVKIINDDKTLNAFCTPGGYIYVYTGLIKFLQTEDQLAGVMGHEIAHADQRHSTRQMTKMYGVSVLLSVLAGNQESLAQITTGLINLKFGRNHEKEADNYSVVYLGGTHYNCTGAAGFFERMKNRPSPPEFLSTHPNPANRVANINVQAQKQGCSTKPKNDQSRYKRLKSLL